MTPNLPLIALKAHLFPVLQGQALLSIGTFCNAGCIATFTAMSVKIEHAGKLVLEGAHMPPGLWAINLPQHDNNTNKASLAYSGQITTAAIKFLHAACFSPTTGTWTQAINKGFLIDPSTNSKNSTQAATKIHGNCDGAHGPNPQKHVIHTAPKTAQQQRGERV
jgi:hypothetical protein